MSNQPLKLVIVGHVDHGKSTLIGRILHDTNSIAPEKVEKVKRICEEQQKPYEYAFLLDALEEEQLQGITIDTTQIRFETEHREFLIIDAPGHKEFLKNMISGATQADAAVLIIDAHEGVKEQSKRHGYLLSLLGIKNVIVVVNKLDLVDYSQSAFNQVKEEYDQFLKTIDIEALAWVPVSAREGVNITSHSVHTPWYTEKPILQLLEGYHPIADDHQDELRLTVQDVYKWDDKRVIAGRVGSGTLRVGDHIEILPTGHTSRVKTIETWAGEPGAQTEIGTGYSAAFTLEDALFVDRGHVIAKVSHKPKVTHYLTTNIFWFSDEPLTFQKRFKIKIGPQERYVQLHKVVSVFDSSSLNIHSDVDQINKLDAAKVVFKTEQPIAADTFSEFVHSARFVISGEYDVFGGGIIEYVHESDFSNISEPVSTERREFANGHRKAIIQIDSASEKQRNDVGKELERMLFNSGIRSFYLSEDKKDTVDVLLQSGHVVIIPRSELVKADHNVLATDSLDQEAKRITEQLKI